MQVTYLDHMGSDLTVVNAARVSFNKKSEWAYKLFDDCNEHDDFLFENLDWWDDTDYDGYGPMVAASLSEKDRRLISYLAKYGHWTPFAHPQTMFHIKAPIFVARQLAKHQIGMVWNEVSRRYVDDEPEFYIPDKWRGKAENKKQGSSEEEVTQLYHKDHEGEDLWGPFDNNWHPSIHVDLNTYHAKDMYKWLLKSGVAPELARMVLPQNTYTEWYWTGSLAAWARVVKQRTDDHAQFETRLIAEQISNEMKRLFPISWAALIPEGDV